MERKKILLVGGAGYVGSHAARYLAEKGFLPICYDNLVNGHRWAVQWGPLEVGSAGDARRLSEVLTAHRPSAVMHFAAFAYVGESVGDPAKYYRNNVQETLVLLDTLRQHGVGNVVFSSTCAIYGAPARMPIAEDAPKDPINPYGASKLMVERILEDYDRAYGLKSVRLRYFNAAGAAPDGSIGENHDPETHLIPLALEAARGDRTHLSVFGSDYPTPDGTCVRDYIHVVDLAQAHCLAMRFLLDGRGSDSFNLGNGDGHSVRQVIDSIRRVTGREVPVSWEPRRPGDPPILLADAGKAKHILGWAPEYADLDGIIATAWNWYRSRREAWTPVARTVVTQSA